MADYAFSSLRVCVHRELVCINDVPVSTAGPASAFHEILGPPDRIADASPTPAPVGHRNNQFHFYETLGITLNEHHYTHQVHAINFVFDRELAHHPTNEVFSGTMEIAGRAIRPGDTIQVLSGLEIAFTGQLGTWFATIQPADGPALRVGISSDRRRQSSGRRSGSRYISSVAFCLHHDAWDESARPGS